MSFTKPLSRLHPAYLARHYGVGILIWTALGFAAGAVYFLLGMPRHYESAEQVAIQADSRQLSEEFAIWENLVSGTPGRERLAINLRYAMKQAVTGADAVVDAQVFRQELVKFRTPRFFSRLPAGHFVKWPPEPEAVINLDDIIANLDFQTLARILTGLEARNDFPIVATGIDVSVAPELSGNMVVDPENDRFFALFSAWRAQLAPERPDTPIESWTAAVDIVNRRLKREIDVEGTGGFGPAAMRELAVELHCLPVLVANGLEKGGSAWFGAKADPASGVFSISQAATGPGVDISWESTLYPLLYPQDSPETRIQPLALRTAWAIITAYESGKSAVVQEPVSTPVESESPRMEETVQAPTPSHEPDMPPTPEPTPPPQPQPPPPPAQPAAKEPPAPAKVVNPEIEQLIALRATTMANRDAARRYLASLDEKSAELKTEAANAAARVDRLRDRLDALEDIAAVPPEPKPEPEEIVGLRLQRATLIKNLEELLQSCTEEHPYVRQIRRELAGIDATLSLYAPEQAKPTPDRTAVRRQSLKAEIESTLTLIKGLAMRRDNMAPALAEANKALSAAERMLADTEFRLARAKDLDESERSSTTFHENVKTLATHLAETAKDKTPQTPVLQPVASAPPPAAAADSERKAVATAPATPKPVDKKPVVIAVAKLSLPALPAVIALHRRMNGGHDILWQAALAGLALGVLLMLRKEIFSPRMITLDDASRLVPLHVLGGIGAYDQKSLKTGAKAMGGQAIPGKFGINFIPSLVEGKEPPPLDRRPALAAAKRGLRWYLWVILLIVLAVGSTAVLADKFSLWPRQGSFEQDVWEKDPAHEQSAPQQGREE